MNGFHTLPHELQIQILLNLPPTAVFSLRLVCASWNTILSSPHTERAISLSLQFPSTAPDLRSRLLRRTRLLRGDPVQIWDVDEGEETVTLYCDGFVITSNGRCGSAGRLGIWDCRKAKGEDGCVARVDLKGLVKECYPELWEDRSQSVEVEQLDCESGECRTEMPLRLVIQYSWAENGLVLLALGERGNPRQPRHPKYVSVCLCPSTPPPPPLSPLSSSLSPPLILVEFSSFSPSPPVISFNIGNSPSLAV